MKEYIYGEKSDKPKEPRTPIEDPNTLQSRAIAKFVDLISEGEIEGLVNGEESVYFNNIPIRDGENSYNYQGASYEFKPGAPDGISLRDYPTSESEISVDIHIVKSVGSIVRAITDTDVDDLRLTFTIPSLFSVNSANGDILKTTVEWHVDIRTQGGAYIRAASVSKYGKCISAYQTDIRIDQLSRYYGAGPWDVKVTRITDDSDSNSLQNDLYWSGYTKIINRVLIYPDTCLIGVTINSQQFGSRVPSRSYEVYGMRCQIPSNYNPVDRSYGVTWDGTFQRAYTDNPAWILYDLANNDRYGLGLEAEHIDKWGLYTIAQYCDGLVDDSFGSLEPRFTFNGVLQSRTDVIHAINMICSNFRGMPYWAGGQLRVSQDSPKDSSKLVTAANVIEGMFTYSYSSIDNRYTICNVSWNDPDNFYKLTVEAVDDKDGLERYGYRPSDVTAIGCTSRGQAYRFGRWFLYTSLNETETITYRAAWDHADVMPGEVITVMDNHEAATVAGGRLVSTTANTATLDRGVLLEIGQTYDMTFVDPEGTLVERAITTAPDDAEHITVDLGSSWPGAVEPQVDSVWIMSASNLEPVDYRVVTNTEVEPNIFEITAVIYDPNKYAAVEDGKLFAPAPITKVPDANTQLAPPTNIQIEEYTYEDTGGTSERADRKTGVLLSWTHTRDTRFQNYEVQWKSSTGSFADNELVETTDNQFDIKPLEANEYTFRVRATGMTRESVWLTLSEYSVIAKPGAPPNVTGLTSIEEGVSIGTAFNGQDCEIGWDALVLATDTTSLIIYDSTSPTHSAPFDSQLTKIKDFQIEVLTNLDAHLRYDFVTENKYKYLFAYNKLDNPTGSPIRDIKFRVWARDIFDQLSSSPATIIVSNPAPSMSSQTPTVTDIFTGLKTEWDKPTDNDMLKYKILIDTSNPPTTEVGEVGGETTYWVEPNLSTTTTYYVKIVPYDEFGVGVATLVGSGEPLKLPADDVIGELVSRLVMSDSLDSTAETLAKLYDNNKIADGITYGNTDWAQYGFPTDQLLDRVSVWASKPFNCYFSTSLDGITYTFFKAEADHTLDANGRLIEATNEADAITNYWAANAGDGGNNTALFPNGLNMAYAKIHILTAFTEVYQLRFVDQVIAEWVVANELSAISANVGVLTSGLIQSGNLSATNGILIDLDNDRITMGGTTDEDIVFDGNTATITVTDSGSIEVGQLGTINVGADGEITVGERGRIVVGNDNIILDGNSNSIIIAPDGGQAGQDYAEFSAGNLDLFYWYQGQHENYRILTRMETGTCSNDTWTQIPGIWKNIPKILVSPYQLQSYVGGRYNQSQIFDCSVTDLRLQSGHTQKWEFKARALLVLSAAATGTVPVGFSCSKTCVTSTVTPPVGTTKIVVNGSITSQYYVQTWDDKDNSRARGCYHLTRLATVYLRVNGGIVASYAYAGTGINTVYSFTLSYSGPVSYFDLYTVAGGLNNNSRIYLNAYCPTAKLDVMTTTLNSYTGDIPGTSQLATGSLNWIAVGE